jgi:hypothetical protein
MAVQYTSSELREIARFNLYFAPATKLYAPKSISFQVSKSRSILYIPSRGRLPTQMFSEGGGIDRRRGATRIVGGLRKTWCSAYKQHPSKDDKQGCHRIRSQSCLALPPSSLSTLVIAAFTCKLQRTITGGGIRQAMRSFCKGSLSFL